MKFFVEGTMSISGVEKQFVLELEAQSEKLAKEKALCDLGSNHKLPRSKINISKVEKV
ncbi:50S ribosomal protein L18a [Candidatus Parvarchaeota archaeon]|nr:50S ribosomal protein L18a [Candidatus Parvarchaeota archaeon]